MPRSKLLSVVAAARKGAQHASNSRHLLSGAVPGIILGWAPVEAQSMPRSFLVSYARARLPPS